MIVVNFDIVDTFLCICSHDACRSYIIFVVKKADGIVKVGAVNAHTIK